MNGSKLVMLNGTLDDIQPITVHGIVEGDRCVGVRVIDRSDGQCMSAHMSEKQIGQFRSTIEAAA